MNGDNAVFTGQYRADISFYYDGYRVLSRRKPGIFNGTPGPAL